MPRTGRPKQSQDIEVDCLQCGKHWIQPEWKNTGVKFCSRACFYKYRVGKPQEWLRIKPDERTCPGCSARFLVGGGGRPPRHRRFCSRQCAVASKGYRTVSKPLDTIDAAYIAGFIDGEGCISFYKRGPSVGVKLFAH